MSGRTVEESVIREWISEGIGDTPTGIPLDDDSPETITSFWAGSQAEYDGLTPDANTIYFITA